MKGIAQGEMIRKGRVAKGLTQQELADATGISLRSVQRVEKAEVSPRMFTLKTLAAYLEVDLMTPVHSEVAEPSDLPDPVFVKDQGPVESVIRRAVTTVVSAVIFLLGAASFLSQSSRFPETDFELFMFWMLISMLFLGVVLIIWRPKSTSAHMR